MGISKERIENTITNKNPNYENFDVFNLERIYSFFNCDSGEIMTDTNTRGYISQFTRLLTKEFVDISIFYKLTEEDVFIIFSKNNEGYYFKLQSKEMWFDSETFRFAFNEFLEIIPSDLQFYSLFSLGGRDSGDLILLGNKEQAISIAQIIEYNIDEFQFY